MMPDDETGTYQDFLNEFQPGFFLGKRYKILKMLGAGGMGRVFMTRDLELDLDVALKVIRPELLQSEKALERLKNELILARRVSHKNVVRIHDIGEVRGVKYLTMTYIAGKSLRDTLRESGALDLTRAVQIFIQICEGVAAAHDEGVMHRDLKPANVMIDDDDRVYLTDFGIAKWLDAPDETATGVLIGTPAYLSPEQTWGERPDARSDIYALGLILYELLTGELPFHQQNAAAFKSRLPSDLPLRLKKAQPEIPRYLISIVQMCLDPDKGSRYQSVNAIIRDLKNQSASSKLPLLKYGIAVGCILVSLIAAIAVWKLHPQKEPAPQTKASIGQPPQAVRSAVVLPFRNKTGKEELSWVQSTLGDLLISDLSQLSGMRMISSDRVFQMMNDLKFNPATYDEENANKIADLLDTSFLIQGYLTQVGSAFRADVQVSDRTDSKNNFRVQATGNRQEDLLPMIDQLSREIQQKLQSKPDKITTKHANTRPSLATMKLFQEGVQKLRSNNPEGAIPEFQQCIHDDPHYAEAYLNLSHALSQSGKDEEAAAILQKAIDLGITGDDKTGITIEAEYRMMQGEVEKATELYKNLSVEHPYDPDILRTLADAYEQSGERDKAIAVLKKVISLDPNEPQAYFQLGKDTILQGNADQAISQYLIKALSIQTQQNNQQGQADVLNAMGVAYERLGRYDDALKYYQDSFAIKERIGNQKSATVTLTNIAKIYLFQSQFDKAKTILHRALTVYQNLNDQAGVADVQNTLGVIDENEGQYNDALQHYKNALQVRKDLGDDRLTGLSYDNIGQIYFLMAHYDEAQAFTEQALALRRKVNDQNGIILSLQSLGFLQLAQGDLDRSLKYFLDALNQARSIKFENAIAVSLGNMGTIYQHQARYDAALASYNEAIDTLKHLADRKGQAEYIKLTGNTLLEMGAFDAAKAQLQRAKELAEEIRSDEILTDVANSLARLNRLQGNLSDAQNQIAAAETIGEKNHYEKGTLTAKLEKGLLTDSDSILKSVNKQATDLHDIWLELETQYALALVYLNKNETLQTIQICEKAIPVAKRLKTIPYLYRLHSIEAQAYAKRNESTKAKDHFNQASIYVESIRKELKPEHVADFLQVAEVKAVQR